MYIVRIIFIRKYLSSLLHSPHICVLTIKITSLQEIRVTSNYPSYLIVNNICIVVFLICPTSVVLECKYLDYTIFIRKTGHKNEITGDLSQITLRN